MYLLQYFHLLISLVFILYCQTQIFANGNINNNTLKSTSQAVVKNGTNKLKEPLKTDSSERSFMRDYGTKYELPIILQNGKSVPAKTSENVMKIIVNLTRPRFHNDGQDAFRPPDDDISNNSNGFYSVKRGNSKNSIGKTAAKHGHLMPPFALDFKIPDTSNRGVQSDAGCHCECPYDGSYQVHQRSYQEKGNDEGRDIRIDVEFGDGGGGNENENEEEGHFRLGDNRDDSGDMGRMMELNGDGDGGGPERNPEDDYNNYSNHFSNKWKHQQPTVNNQEFGSGSQRDDNGNADQQQQQKQQPRQHQHWNQKTIGNTADITRVAVACDFSQTNCNFENDRYDESRFRYGYNVHFKDKLWYIDHFPQRRFPGPNDQKISHGWGRLMTPVYDLPRDAGRDACMLIEFEFDSEGTDQLTVMLQESDNSRTILDYMHERPNERDSLLLRKYVHFIVTSNSMRFFIQFTFDTKQANSQYGLRNFELYWSMCPFSKQLTNTAPSRPLEFV